MIVAQLTDTHIRAPGRLAYRVVDTAACLRRAVAHLGALRPRPDAAVATGDLVDGGHPDEYRHLRELLAPLPMPVYLVPGNHDNREALARAFADHGYLPRHGGFLQYAVEHHPLRLIGLDTVVPGSGAGRLCPERLAWLDAQLAAAPARPTVIFMHHPPFATGIDHMDSIGLDGAEAMAAVVRRHSQVERIICGHLHRPIQVRWAGTLASTAPSTAHQVVLDLSAHGPAAFNLEPPAVQLHLWHGGVLVSHTSYVGEFGGPFPFFEGTRLISE
jgi:3',5'-cyclic-AMP phosphodiesterase